MIKYGIKQDCLHSAHFKLYMQMILNFVDATILKNKLYEIQTVMGNGFNFVQKFKL